VAVGHEQASELALVIALDEPDSSRARNDAQHVEPAKALKKATPHRLLVGSPKLSAALQRLTGTFAQAPIMVM